MKKITLITLLIFSTCIQAQKLPDDILDTNAAFVFNPSITIEDTRETIKSFCTSLLESGVDLVSKNFYHDNQASLKEIEFDVKNKNVKYIFLLTLAKEDTYSLQIYENTSANFNTLNPKSTLMTYGPDSEKRILKDISKDFDKLKSDSAQLISTDHKDLFNSLVLTPNEVQMLSTLNEINTIVGGSLLEIKEKGVPSELKSNKLAIIGVTLDEFNREFRRVNSILILKTKNYPFEYTYFQTYKEYKKAGGDDAFRYRLQLSKQDEIDLGSVKQKPAAPGKVAKSQTAHDYNFIPINYSKEFFTVILKDNKTKQKYIVSNKGVLAQAIKEFVDSLTIDK